MTRDSHGSATANPLSFASSAQLPNDGVELLPFCFRSTKGIHGSSRAVTRKWNVEPVPAPFPAHDLIGDAAQ
jgi:hypothetical protein